MYNIIDKSNDYFVFISSKNKHSHIGDKQSLISYLSHKRQVYGLWIDTPIFYDVNVTGKDKKWSSTTIETEEIDEFGDSHIVKISIPILVDKEYTFYDGYGRIVDVRIFKKEVEKYSKKNENRPPYWSREQRKDNFEPGETYVKGTNWTGNLRCYVFRRGPVPGTGRYRWGRCYRRPKINSIRKEVSNPEVRDFIRKKSLPNSMYGYWDDYTPRHLEKSWKKQKKCRHQWQKNM